MAPFIPFCLGIAITTTLFMSLFAGVALYSLNKHNKFRETYEPIIAENNIVCTNRSKFERAITIMQTREKEQFGKIKSNILNSKLFFRGYQTNYVCLPFPIIDEVSELWEISKAKYDKNTKQTNVQPVSNIDNFAKKYAREIDLLTDLLILDALVSSLQNNSTVWNLNETDVQNGKRETFLKPSNRREVDLQNETQTNVTKDMEPKTEIIEI
jgi:hypothetical protein